MTTTIAFRKESIASDIWSDTWLATALTICVILRDGQFALVEVEDGFVARQAVRVEAETNTGRGDSVRLGEDEKEDERERQGVETGS